MLYEVYGNYYGDELEYLDYLSHHGVREQRWGVKNGPPYPIQRGHKVRLDSKKMSDETKDQYGMKEQRRFSKTVYRTGRGKPGAWKKLEKTKEVKLMAEQISKNHRSGAESGSRCQEQYAKTNNSIPFLMEWSPKAVARKWAEYKDYNGKPIKSRDEQDSMMLSMGYVPQFYMAGYTGIKSYYMDRPFATWLLDSGDPKATQYRNDMKNYNAMQEKNYQTCRKMIDYFTGENGMDSLTGQQKAIVYDRGAEAAQRIVNKQMVKEANQQAAKEFRDLLRS